MSDIRNFSIIAHVDHGKSTLADRLLEITGTVAKDKMRAQLLDSLQLERERGITIKLAPVRMNYTLDAMPYTLNLIDTPGHIDFSYEVSRALAAVEGVILLIDATQGIQAQTLSHGLAAVEQNLTLIPVINKVDLPNADVERCRKQIIDSFGFSGAEILLASAKTGQGVEEILRAVIERIPPPGRESDRPLKALIFGSYFDAYKGVVAQVRIVVGQTPPISAPIFFLGTQSAGQIAEAGYFTPQLQPAPSLSAGEIGYIATGIKQADRVRVGDTISSSWSKVDGSWQDDQDILVNTEPLPGYRQAKPMVFVGLYPIDQDSYHKVKDALERFRLNDPAFTYEPENSKALGAGFRCGFLGLLHAEVVQERLSEEFGVDLLATSPTVEYLVSGRPFDNPADLDISYMKDIAEPWVRLEIFVPQEFIGPIMELVQDKRGKFSNIQYFGLQTQLSYEMPLAEMITDFYDLLKSASSGYASLDWEFLGFRRVDAVRVDILVAGEKVDALAQIVVKDRAEGVGRKLVGRLKDVLPRQNFAIALQAAIGGTVIARETVSPYRKDVTAKLYGGDHTRRDKLLEKQKKGKRKMKMIGRVEIPQEAFLTILKS